MERNDEEPQRPTSEEVFGILNSVETRNGHIFPLNVRAELFRVITLVEQGNFKLVKKLYGSSK